MFAAAVVAALSLTLHSASTVTDFRQRDPHDGMPASRATTAYVSYDDQNLKVRFVCKDDPKLIRARLARREDIAQDDQVVVLLDTFHDRRRAYLFAVNPLGVQRDGIVAEGQKDDYTFDAVWSSEGHLTADGYEVKIAIPFRSLRFNEAPSQTWGIALGRVIPRFSEESYWPHITKKTAGFVPQMAELRGLRNVSPGRNVQLAPYMAASQAQFVGPAVHGVRSEQRFGLDAKAVFRDAVTLDVTARPDFSQVESDDPQVTANQRFEVQFPEKRPFFLENAGFFQTPVNLMFSRRIADPQFGVRATGKAAGYAFGVLASDDRAAGPRRDEHASIGVLRLQREIGPESTIGIFVSDRELATTRDRTFAIDGRMRLNEHWALQAQGVFSSAPGFFAELKREGRDWDYTGRYTDLARGFRAPLGFVKRVDIRQLEQSAKYRWRPANGLVVKYGPSIALLGNWDHTGLLQDWQADTAFKVELTGRTEFELTRTEAFERFESHAFRRNATMLTVSSEWLDWLSGSLSISRGTDINFKHARDVEAFLGRSTDATVAICILPTSRLRIEPTLIYSTIDRVFTDAVSRLKVAYQLTPRLSLRTILDYNALAPNPALSRLEKTNRITGDFLVTYLVAPGTAAYAGYSETVETSRQVFFKISYLWRY